MAGYTFAKFRFQERIPYFLGLLAALARLSAGCYRAGVYAIQQFGLIGLGRQQ